MATVVLPAHVQDTLEYFPLANTDLMSDACDLPELPYASREPRHSMGCGSVSRRRLVWAMRRVISMAGKRVLVRISSKTHNNTPRVRPSRKYRETLAKAHEDSPYERKTIYPAQRLSMPSPGDDRWEASKPIGLIIACRNYTKPLLGVEYDIALVYHLLTAGMNWTQKAIKIMTDHMRVEPSMPIYPSKSNIFAQLQTFVPMLATSKAGLLTFSAHGFQKMCPPGKTDEVDNKDEFISLSNGESIIDDDFKEKIVVHAPDGSTLLVLIDMCHGGTLLDLPYEVDFDELADNMAPSGRGPQDGHGLVVSISATDDSETTEIHEDRGGDFTNAVYKALNEWAKSKNHDNYTLAELVSTVQNTINRHLRFWEKLGECKREQHITVYSSHDPTEVDINLVLRNLFQPRKKSKLITP